jgi:hypothetical protein
MNLSELKLGFDGERYHPEDGNYCSLYLCKPTPQTDGMVWTGYPNGFAIAVRSSALPRPLPWGSTPMMLAEIDDPLTLKCLLLHLASLPAEQRDKLRNTFFNG